MPTIHDVKSGALATSLIAQLDALQRNRKSMMNEKALLVAASGSERNAGAPL